MSNRKIILNALGFEDSFLKKDPNITFLKSKHKKHTNFAKNIIKINPNSMQNDKINYNFGEIVDFDIDKSGDLLLNVSLEIILEGSDWINKNLTVGETIYSLIDYIEILADTKLLERLTGEWIYIWDNLNKSNNCIYQTGYASNLTQVNNTEPYQYKILLNIPFWFCLNAGLALPLWAIQHERINIKLKLKNKTEICLDPMNINLSIKNINLNCEIVDLDVLEKEKFRNTDLEYLIEQIEIVENNNIEANINSKKKIEIEKYPYVAEIYWIFKGKKFTNTSSGEFNPANYFNYWLNFDGNPLTRIDHTKNTTILINGNPINSRVRGSYYRKITRYECHNTNEVKDLNGELIKNPNYYSYNCIYSYSFSLNPNNVKPAGFLSTNKFNTMHLEIELNSAKYDRILNIYIKRYNIMRISNGYINLINN